MSECVSDELVSEWVGGWMDGCVVVGEQARE